MNEPDFEPKTAWQLYLLPGLAFILAMLLILLAALQAPALAEARTVARPVIPVNVDVIKAPCPGMEGEVAGCGFRANEADMNGHAYTRDTVYTDGYRFTTLHELGHIYADRFLDHGERNRFANLTDRIDYYWTGSYEDEQGRLIQDPASLDEVFADAFANCALGHVVASGKPWEAGYDYYPTAREHREVCRFIVRAGLTPGTPVDADGWR
jgi:hypothetical protein